MYYPYILCFVFLYWVSVAWHAFERKMEKEVDRSRDSGGSRAEVRGGGASPSYFKTKLRPKG